MRFAYREVDFRAATLATIDHANQLAETYAAQGYSLTLRQLYYRFVAAGLIPNKQSEYKRLGAIITDARYAGMFDWSLLEDRTRQVEGGDGSNVDPAEVIQPSWFNMALWEGQAERVEVWVEKDALVDVVGQAAGRLRVPYFSCRGYTSASELWAAAQRLEGYLDTEDVESIKIIHLGDHDPSGIDMTRDITVRLEEFLQGDGYYAEDLTIDRIALNMDQIEQYNPPPNPAKSTDSRFEAYYRRHGPESWELDALEPQVLDGLVTAAIQRAIGDTGKMRERIALEEKGQHTLKVVKAHYPEVLEFLTDKGYLKPETE